jgi:hypothetical protein
MAIGRQRLHRRFAALAATPRTPNAGGPPGFTYSTGSFHCRTDPPEPSTSNGHPVIRWGRCLGEGLLRSGEGFV